MLYQSLSLYIVLPLLSEENYIVGVLEMSWFMLGGYRSLRGKKLTKSEFTFEIRDRVCTLDSDYQRIMLPHEFSESGRLVPSSNR